MLRTLALLASAGSVLVSFWLLSVITMVLPRLGAASRIPFWTVVMAGFFVYGAASGYAIQRAVPPPVLRRALIAVSITAIVLGGLTIADNELSGLRGGDWEGYISMMGIVLAGHGALLIAYFVRGSRVETHA